MMKKIQCSKLHTIVTKYWYFPCRSHYQWNIYLDLILDLIFTTVKVGDDKFNNICHFFSLQRHLLFSAKKTYKFSDIYLRILMVKIYCTCNTPSFSQWPLHTTGDESRIWVGYLILKVKWQAELCMSWASHTCICLYHLISTDSEKLYQAETWSHPKLNLPFPYWWCTFQSPFWFWLNFINLIFWVSFGESIGQMIKWPDTFRGQLNLLIKIYTIILY